MATWLLKSRGETLVVVLVPNMSESEASQRSECDERVDVKLEDLDFLKTIGTGKMTNDHAFIAYPHHNCSRC